MKTVFAKIPPPDKETAMFFRDLSKVKALSVKIRVTAEGIHEALLAECKRQDAKQKPFTLPKRKAGQWGKAAKLS